MNLRAYIRTRLDRGVVVRLLGPNEARVLYDSLVGLLGACAAVAFSRFFGLLREVQLGSVVLVVSELSVLLVTFNLLLGVYSYLRLARTSVKCTVLCLSVLLAAGLVWLAAGETQAIVLWAILVPAPLAIPRLMASLHLSRHPELLRISANRRGPILVIGGAGYIGSHAVELLLQRGYNVRVLDRLMYGAGSLADFQRHPRFTLITGDATDIAKLTAAVKDCSAVVQLAGLVGDPACAVEPAFTRHANIVATRMARIVAESAGVHRFIFASSCSVYGVTGSDASETSPVYPVSLYAQTKLDSEKELLSLACDDFFVTVLRFATVFGHSRRPRFDLVANLFAAQAVVDGRIHVIGPGQWRPFIHVRDLARAILAVLEARPVLTQSQVFNVGDRRLNLTMLQLAGTVQRIASQVRPVEISVDEKTDDVRSYRVSFDKIRSVLKFEAATLLEDGIREVVDQLAAGNYRNYRDTEFNNVAMIAKALRDFRDPAELAKLYAPLYVEG